MILVKLAISGPKKVAVSDSGYNSVRFRAKKGVNAKCDCVKWAK